jgi:hypothetical protein
LYAEGQLSRFREIGACMFATDSPLSPEPQPSCFALAVALSSDGALCAFPGAQNGPLAVANGEDPFRAVARAADAAGFPALLWRPIHEARGEGGATLRIFATLFDGFAPGYARAVRELSLFDLPPEMALAIEAAQLSFKLPSPQAQRWDVERRISGAENACLSGEPLAHRLREPESSSPQPREPVPAPPVRKARCAA